MISFWISVVPPKIDRGTHAIGDAAGAELSTGAASPCWWGHPADQQRRFVTVLMS